MLNTKYFNNILLSLTILLFPSVSWSLNNGSEHIVPIVNLLLSSGSPALTIAKTNYAPDEPIKVSFLNLPVNHNDWIGIYPKDTNNDWANVIRWSFTNGTKIIDGPGVASGLLTFKGLRDSGKYEARLFFNNSYSLEAKAAFSVAVLFGARSVQSTPLEQGTLFASPNGNGNICSDASPCTIQTAIDQLSAGDVLFLRGGNYIVLSHLNVTSGGTEEEPIIIESYPGELAVLDGQNETNDDIIAGSYPTGPGLWVHTNNNYISIRKIEVKNMSEAGIAISSSHNTVEGCTVHNNHYNGIHIVDGANGYDAPYVNGYNTIRDNIVFNNSDVGLINIPGTPYNDGGNSDGISVSSSKHNTITHNTVYSNSDDGIDTWRSNDAYIAFNLVYDNGKGSGNGNGIKSGSTTDNVTALRARVEHNIVYNNRHRGLNSNGGLDAVLRYNTSYNNGSVGFKTTDNTTVEYNIASNANGDSQTDIKDGHAFNSWQEEEGVIFISTDPNSVDFLKPESGSVFENMGAYSHW